MTDHANSAPASAVEDAARYLALETNYLAHERTQLSWIQVSLALISFGFTIAKVIEVLQEKVPEKAPRVTAGTVGILMISGGLIALTASTFQHQRTIRAMRQHCPRLPVSQSSILSIMLAALGVVALLGVALRW